MRFSFVPSSFPSRRISLPPYCSTLSAHLFFLFNWISYKIDIVHYFISCRALFSRWACAHLHAQHYFSTSSLPFVSIRNSIMFFSVSDIVRQKIYLFISVYGVWWFACCSTVKKTSRTWFDASKIRFNFSFTRPSLHTAAFWFRFSLPRCEHIY